MVSPGHNNTHVQRRRRRRKKLPVRAVWGHTALDAVLRADLATRPIVLQRGPHGVHHDGDTPKVFPGHTQHIEQCGRGHAVHPPHRLPAHALAQEGRATGKDRDSPNARNPTSAMRSRLSIAKAIFTALRPSTSATVPVPCATIRSDCYRAAVCDVHDVAVLVHDGLLSGRHGLPSFLCEAAPETAPHSSGGRRFPDSSAARNHIAVELTLPVVGAECSSA